MRKWILGVGVVSLVVASMAVAAPAGANHAPEGTVTVAGVEQCSGTDATPNDGKCTWTAKQKDTGWTGVGPFTISWVSGGITKSVTCPANTICRTPAGTNPVPTNSVVTSNGRVLGGRGTFAAGDADESE